MIAYLVFVEKAMIEDVEYHATAMNEVIKGKDIDTWVVGDLLEMQGDHALAYIMKVWPTKCQPTKMLSSVFNNLLEELERSHC